VNVNTFFKQIALPSLALSLAAFSAGAVSFTNLFIFNGTDGANPVSGLVLSGNTFYGTSMGGGTNGDGTVFAVNTDGSGFTNLYEFSGFDGRAPYGPLVLSGNVLYGTTSVRGGTNGGYGTVFAINTNGTGFTNLFIFTGTNNQADGATPIAGLVSSGNTLYGTTEFGGVSGEGDVFAINTDGTDFTNFYAAPPPSGALCPHAGLVLAGNTLYGVMSQGGAGGNGAVFAINTDGAGLTNLYSFSQTAPYVSNYNVLYNTNADGALPITTLLLSSNTLFGTTLHGGTEGGGTVFRVNTDGTGFTNLYNFPAIGQAGAYSILGVLSGNTLYGTSSEKLGRVFAVNTDGTGYTNLVGAGNDLGYVSAGGLLLSGHTLYGTQTAGGSFNGSVFAVTLPPPSLNIQLINGAVILSWNDPTSTYSLQTAPNVDGIYTNMTGATSPCTNVINDSQEFFRLQSD
jgi:uncharacterized repeat protein (TIGR03803 family)